MRHDFINAMGCGLVLRNRPMIVKLSELGSQWPEKHRFDQLSAELDPAIINDEVGGLLSVKSIESVYNFLTVSTPTCSRQRSLLRQISRMSTHLLRRLKVQSFLLKLLNQRIQTDRLRALNLLLQVPHIII